MEIHKRILDAMADIEAIPKDRKNAEQKYSFRGIDDVYASLHGVLAKHRIYTVPEVVEEHHEERLSRSGGTLIWRVLKVRYHFTTDDGSEVVATVVGEGMDSGDKAGNKAMSSAHKYALLQVFAIPTEYPKDSEFGSPELCAIDATTLDGLTQAANGDELLRVFVDAKMRYAGNGAALAAISEAKDKRKKELGL